MKKLLYSSILLGAALFSQTISVSSHWKLLGATEDINNMAVFDSSCTRAIFTYSNGVWKVYPSTISAKLDRIDSIKKGEGFWIIGSSDCVVDTNATVSSTVDATDSSLESVYNTILKVSDASQKVSEVSDGSLEASSSTLSSSTLSRVLSRALYDTVPSMIFDPNTGEYKFPIEEDGIQTYSYLSFYDAQTNQKIMYDITVLSNWYQPDADGNNIAPLKDYMDSYTPDFSKLYMMIEIKDPMDIEDGDVTIHIGSQKSEKIHLNYDGSISDESIIFTASDTYAMFNGEKYSLIDFDIEFSPNGDEYDCAFGMDFGDNIKADIDVTQDGLQKADIYKDGTLYGKIVKENGSYVLLDKDGNPIQMQ